MAMAEMTKGSEADRNFSEFSKLLPELIDTHRGKFAVMHDGKVREFFDSLGDAVRFGAANFGSAFSVQEVTSRNVNLGCHSYAVQHISA